MHSDDAAALPEALPMPRKPAWHRRVFTRKFLLISLAAHLLFVGGAAFWVVKTIQPPPKRTFRSSSVSPNPATRAFEHQVKMKKKSAMSSAPATAKRVTTTGSTKISLPAMPAMPMQPALASLSPAQMAGMGAAGAGMGLGGSSLGTGFANAGSGIFTSSIGGLNIRAQRLAVALDVSGSVKQYQEEMHAYVAKTFKGSEVSEFGTAGFTQNQKKGASIGSVLLDFLNSPKKFDAIYVFSDFGETRNEQVQWPEVQKLIEAKKVRLYLHVLRTPGKEDKINPVLADIIAFARKTGGSVKVGQMARVSDSG